jgi:hypothetical protein
VSSQLQALAELLLGKGAPIPIVREAGWAPEPVWTTRGRKNSSLQRDLDSNHSVDRSIGNGNIVPELWFGKYVKGSHSGLVHGLVTEFNSRDSMKTMRNTVTIVGAPARFQFTTYRIKVGKFTSWENILRHKKWCTCWIIYNELFMSWLLITGVYAVKKQCVSKALSWLCKRMDSMLVESSLT